MGWADKELAKHRMRKQVDQVLHAPEYRKERQKWEEQAILNALMDFTFIGMAYLEDNFRCKKNGLQNFLDYIIVTMKRMGVHNDLSFFNDSNKYYIEHYNIDVLDQLGLALVKKGEKN